MQIFPIYVPGFPSSCINRIAEMDPSYLPYRWADFTKEIVPVDLDIDVEYNADRTEIKATANVNFVKDFDNADYRLSFALVADNLKNDIWKQTNYYAGEESGDGVDSELWDLFLNGGSKVSGLTFNDVVAYYKDVQGIENSIPSQIKRGESIIYSYIMPMNEVLIISKKEFLTEGCTLHVICIVLDGKTGIPVNCNKSASLHYSLTGVDTVSADHAEVVKVIYHNMQGIEISAAEGICILTEVMSDGTRRSSKIMTR